MSTTSANPSSAPVPDHAVVDRETWRQARLGHLEAEKAFTRQRDALSAARRDLPWLEITDDYVFTSPGGPTSLSELFAGRRQLFMYHFMLGPGWDEGCPSCSFWADGYDGLDVHLAARDTNLVAVSRATLPEIEAYRDRMGWGFTWVSSAGSTFNEDMAVSFDATDPANLVGNYNFGTQDFGGDEAPGVSTFIRDDDDRVFLTYQTFSRGLDMINAAYHMLDLTALGRHEDDLPWSMAWLHRHDAYPQD